MHKQITIQKKRCIPLTYMKPFILTLLVGIAALGFTSPASANITLSLEPTPQSISVGDTTTLDLVISGLGDHASPSLGAFDLDVTFNPSILSPVSVAFGDHLNLGGLGSLQEFNFNAPGSVHVDEISFELPADLNSAQPSSFTLATLGFRGIGPGVSGLDITGASLSDELANSLEFATSGASIEVTGSVPVPDPGSTAALFAIGLSGLVSGLRRSKLSSK
jgi:hypothetical protein